MQIRTTGLDTLTLGENEIDVRYVEQFAEEGQLSLCGWVLRQLQFILDEEGDKALNATDIPFIEGLQKIFSEVEKKEFDELIPYNDGLQALPRLQDVMGVLNRIRFKYYK